MNSTLHPLDSPLSPIYCRECVRTHFIILDTAYHGNSSSVIQLSPYKFNSKGGEGKCDAVHILPVPDVFRYTAPLSNSQTSKGTIQQRSERIVRESGDYMEKFIKDIGMDQKKKCRHNLFPKNLLSGFICESILSCGGQVELPENYLSTIYSKVRNVGGICIADEVQVGMARVGSPTSFWGYQTQNVHPDIVTIGKPIANGFPLGAVLATKSISDSFIKYNQSFHQRQRSSSVEYCEHPFFFTNNQEHSTFAKNRGTGFHSSNGLSVAVAIEVFRILREEKLQQNVIEVGQFLKALLLNLQQDFSELIGDVRGAGLFLGIEFIKDRKTLEPATTECKLVASMMKDLGVIMGVDGPYNNVLKLKPPLCFSTDDCKFLVSRLREVIQSIERRRRSASKL
eukprot:TRINITY_DN2135_c0_g1_i1.p1 TRINITY_DN2135_c0_g1~~TRINITY_DN2135_c0_g1_i1.p1  ORF type:complete len:397 (+),score=79.07 TRINITY_DN2135_c0_g1_i1:464-1654(+)